MERVVLPIVRAAHVAGKADRRRCARGLPTERELPDATSVEAELDLVRRVDATDVADIVRPQPDLDGVLAVDREVMANRRTAA